ncbi:amino acid adenylation domain-containing protein [Micromonospora eburnea]|uniref:Amino acid adenylation domain-containing protein n=1 Tax=Micromonospora eburnea TaxID=227316 RepID=A0A1C6V1A8_9ACTN|nr:amino acid adenylation domain-containing protein [Micromonospora eburnea]SCL60085.1 amino acid adenylation domain-containing protein [Micromonospora eburnea]
MPDETTPGVMPWPLAAIAEQARTRPDAIAAEDTNGVTTYGELWARAGEVAAMLAGLPGPIVAIATERGTPFLAGALGAWRAGRAYVPLDLLNPPARLRRIVADARPAAVLVSGSDQGIGATLGLKELTVPESAQAVDRPDLLEPPAEDDPPAYVLYTSGTTGAPKGVVVGHASLGNLIRWLADTYSIDAADRSLHVCSLGFDVSVFETWPYLALGGTVVTCTDADRIRPEAVAAQVERDRCTTLFLPTGLATHTLADGLVPANLRILFFGGDRMVLPVPLPARPLLVNVYGPTEATVATTTHTLTTGAAGESPPIGRPIGGVEVRVCDSAGREVPAGAKGELYVTGAALAHGYLGNAELTRQRFVTLPDVPGRWYRTGDLVAWEDDVLIFHGRIDREQLKVRGVRVEAGDIEAALLAHEQVHAAAVAVVGSDSERQVVAVLVFDGDQVSPRALRRHLLDSLPSYLIPDRFVAVDEMPLTANGKLDRAQVAVLAARQS